MCFARQAMRHYAIDVIGRRRVAQSTVNQDRRTFTCSQGGGSAYPHPISSSRLLTATAICLGEQHGQLYQTSSQPISAPRPCGTLTSIVHFAGSTNMSLDRPLAAQVLAG
jgi:hypothetical protein